MNFPLVSIGVPSFNRPKTLDRTLRSLVNQTYPNLEIVISDDCSTNPDVESVVKSFLVDSRVKYFRQPINRGAISNFNFILEKLNGEYFMRIADDDWLDLNYVETCLDFLLAHPDYSSAYGLAKVYDPEGKFVMYDSTVQMDQANGGERIKHYFREVSFNSCYYGLMHRSFIPLAISKNIIAMDWLFVARVAFLGKGKLIRNSHTNISMGGDSKSVDHLTQAYGMTSFTKAFPHLSICLNVGKDILFNSQVYKILKISKKLNLVRECMTIIYHKFPVKEEVRLSFAKYIRENRILNYFLSK